MSQPRSLPGGSWLVGGPGEWRRGCQALGEALVDRAPGTGQRSGGGAVAEPPSLPWGSGQRDLPPRGCTPRGWATATETRLPCGDTPWS